ncbi:recombinase family protein, partial [Rhizorhapis sp. SPR117]|uniref:recombinase family protein n=1 Tax=Rhizorhapis sp. SPR117 TaxID=2912611 RepID=UPI001F3452ED|nr:recombinase family protein [Rhizorhapis sp. SPR117]
KNCVTGTGAQLHWAMQCRATERYEIYLRSAGQQPARQRIVYDEVGDVVLDPDAQIREMITHFFETFSRVGSATQTVKAFAREGLLFPSRLRNGKQVVFQPLTASTAMRTLHNPRYAGVYAYGQRLYRRTVDGRKQLRKVDNVTAAHLVEDAAAQAGLYRCAGRTRARSAR